MEEPIIFENPSGLKLYGIVHIPENRNSGIRIGVNLLNPGIKYRVAPNRLNVKIARRLCAMGYFVLRFDPAGVGDSDGELPEGVIVPEIWEDIQKGRFVIDTIKSNDVFIERYDIDHLIVGGNCGGAITGLLASMSDQRIDGLCLIDVPVNLRLPDMKFADKVIAEGERLDFYFSEYLKSAFKIRNWYRFLTLKSDFRSMFKVIKMKLNSFMPKKEEEKQLNNIEEICKKYNLNMGFFKGFSEFIGGEKPVLFILAENDPGTEIFRHFFETGFLSNFRKDHREVKRYVAIHCVEGANHIYTDIEWQNDLINCISDWMEDRFTLTG